MAFHSLAYSQFVLRAPTDSDQHNFRWYEASRPDTVLGNDFYLEVSEPGTYYAVFDGTACGTNATGYFILLRCASPNNQVTLDISNLVSTGAQVEWMPALGGDPLRPRVTATAEVVEYKAAITKVGNVFYSPKFTVVCLGESGKLVDDLVTLFEDTPAVFQPTLNDSDLPNNGSISHTDPAQGTLQVDDNGTPNHPGDDLFTYKPAEDYNGSDQFTYTVCSASGDCSTATVSLTIVPVVDANDDMELGTVGNPLEIRMLTNDNDYRDGDTITFTQPSEGEVRLMGQDTPEVIIDDYFVYEPVSGYAGSDSFTYTLCGENDFCSTATVTLIVTSPEAVEIDSDNDGIVDVFEDLDLDGDRRPDTNPTDTDNDGFPDYLDIDSDNDGIPDNVEAQDVFAYFAPTGQDRNANGLDDTYEYQEILGLTPVDTDGDGFPDYVDEDSDNDGVPDSLEGHDWNLNGSADRGLLLSDTDGDGLDDGFEGDNLDDQDPNDEIDDPRNDLLDLDSDGQPNFRDPDDDGDGINTALEDTNQNGNFSDDDFNGNLIPNYLDPMLPEDDNRVEVFNVLTPNGDGIHDVLKIRNLEKYPDNSVRVFNRWGRMVFSTRAYNTAGNVFDGTSVESATINQPRKLQTGTYFYILTFVDEFGQEQTLTGYIYLNR